MASAQGLDDMSSMTIKTLVTLAAVEIALIGIGAAIVIATYGWLLPKTFPGLKTYSVVVVGVCASAIIGGAVAKWFVGESPTAASWLVIIGAGIAVGLSVTTLSIGILVSMMGS